MWDDWGVAERVAMVRRIGRVLASVHARRFDDHGLITGGDETHLRLRTELWTDILVEKLEYLREIAASEPFDHYLDEVVAAVETNRELLNDAPVALLHGDPARESFSADGRHRIRRLGGRLRGDPGRETRRAQRQLIEPAHHSGSDRTIRTFHDGYREREGCLPAGFDDCRPSYDATSFFDTSGFFDTWAPDAKAPTEELAE